MSCISTQASGPGAYSHPPHLFHITILVKWRGHVFVSVIPTFYRPFSSKPTFVVNLITILCVYVCMYMPAYSERGEFLCKSFFCLCTSCPLFRSWVLCRYLLWITPSLSELGFYVYIIPFLSEVVFIYVYIIRFLSELGFYVCI